MRDRWWWFLPWCSSDRLLRLRQEKTPPCPPEESSGGPVGGRRGRAPGLEGGRRETPPAVPLPYPGSAHHLLPHLPRAACHCTTSDQRLCPGWEPSPERPRGRGDALGLRGGRGEVTKRRQEGGEDGKKGRGRR